MGGKSQYGNQVLDISKVSAVNTKRSLPEHKNQVQVPKDYSLQEEHINHVFPIILELTHAIQQTIKTF